VVLQQDRGFVADRAMGKFFVIVSAPSLHLFLGVGKAQEPMGIEAFLPEAAVNASMKALSSGYPAPLMMASWSCRTTLDPNYAERVLLFADRATFVFLTGFVVADAESAGAAAVVSLLELSSEVVKISR
jgi:hypothetical protein